jgi:hypothetical protein
MHKLKISFVLISKLVALLAITTGFAYSAIPVHGASANKEAIAFSIEKIINQGDDKLVFFKLQNLKTNRPLSLADLKEVHTQKIHLLIIDDKLDDYSHLHPTPTNKPGIYQFTWHPLKKDGTYFIWADIVPLYSGTQQYLQAPLSENAGKGSSINRQQKTTSKVENMTFQLSFDSMPLVVGIPAMGKISIHDANGKPVRELEPIMGAYAHIVGFSEDLKTVVHVHPMGTEPTASTDRGGPLLEFHLQADKAGFIRLFAQVKIKGKELFVPFGLTISPGIAPI